MASNWDWSLKKVSKTPQTRVPSCVEAAEESSGGGGGEEDVLLNVSDNKVNPGEKPVPYVTTAASAVETTAVEQVTVEVDEVKMEEEDHLAREYVQEFVLDHLDPADVKREVISAS